MRIEAIEDTLYSQDRIEDLYQERYEIAAEKMRVLREQRLEAAIRKRAEMRLEDERFEENRSAEKTTRQRAAERRMRKEAIEERREEVVEERRERREEAVEKHRERRKSRHQVDTQV